MGTITQPTPVMWDLVDAYEAEFPSAVFSGINGDAAHQTSPGKHLSRSQNKDKFGSNCWPLQAPNDQKGPTDKAIAVDISMNRTDQNRCHNNFIKVYNNRANDPRAKYIYAFNGWNGSGSPGRYNLYKGTVGTTDDSHKWHEHQEGYYAFVNDSEFVRASRSAFRGESIAEYQGDDDVTPAEFLTILKDPKVAAELARLPWSFAPGNYQVEGQSPVTAHALVLNDVHRWAANADRYLWQGYTQLATEVAGILGNGNQPTTVTNLFVLKLLEMEAMLIEVAKKVDISPEELEQIKQAAHEGAQAGAADVDAIVAGVMAGLNTEGLTEGQQADLEESLRNVLPEYVGPPMQTETPE